VRGLGADLVIDYTADQVSERVKELDAVFDTLAARRRSRHSPWSSAAAWWSASAARPTARGRATTCRLVARPAIWMMTARRRRAAAVAGARFAYLFMRPDGAQLPELARWVDAGMLRPVLHRTYPLAEFREAFAELERGHGARQDRRQCLASRGPEGPGDRGCVSAAGDVRETHAPAPSSRRSSGSPLGCHEPSRR